MKITESGVCLELKILLNKPTELYHNRNRILCKLECIPSCKIQCAISPQHVWSTQPLSVYQLLSAILKASHSPGCREQYHVANLCRSEKQFFTNRHPFDWTGSTRLTRLIQTRLIQQLR